MPIREQLDRAETAFREERGHVEHQKETIRQLQKDGHSTDAAERSLGIMQRSLAVFDRHRRILLERIGLYRP